MLSLLPLLSLPVYALELQPVLDVDLGASYWDEGAKIAAYPGVQTHLWGAEDSLLFGSTFLRLDAVASATPSYARLGPRLTFSPIAILETSAWFLPTAYFGTFSSIKGFDDPDAIYTDELLDNLERGPGWGTLWGAEATVQARLWHLVAASWGTVQGWDITAADRITGQYFWEPESELLIGFQDLTWSLNVVLLYEHVFDEELGRKLYLGGVYAQSTSVQTTDSFMRSGLLSNFALNRQWGFLLTVQAYLDDRVYTSPFPPYVALRARWTMPTPGN